MKIEQSPDQPFVDLPALQTHGSAWFAEAKQVAATPLLSPMNFPVAVPRSRQAGFSLIEVTLAIGIVAFAFISLFGLLPTGLNVFRGAIDTTLGSQIVQQTTDQYQQTDFDELVNRANTDPNGDNHITCYDEQGNLLKNTSNLDSDGTDLTDDQKSAAIYNVRVKIKVLTGVPHFPSSSGSNDQGTPSTNTTTSVATLVIQIAKNPGHDPNPFVDGKNIPVSNYTTYVARNAGAFSAVPTPTP